MPERVVIADDEPEVCMVLSDLLTDAGYEVTAVQDGQACLQAVRSDGPPDLLILDLRLPGLSGRDVLTALRAEPGLADLPVLLVTGSANPADFPPFHTVQGVIAKPFDLDAVLEAVRDCLRARYLGSQPHLPDRSLAVVTLAFPDLGTVCSVGVTTREEDGRKRAYLMVDPVVCAEVDTMAPDDWRRRVRDHLAYLVEALDRPENVRVDKGPRPPRRERAPRRSSRLA